MEYKDDTYWIKMLCNNIGLLNHTEGTVIQLSERRYEKFCYGPIQTDAQVMNSWTKKFKGATG